MGDSYGTVKVAAVQAASVFLDREGSTAKACRLIREAGKAGARVIGFPEGFIPAHPVWYHHHAATNAIANRLAVELFKNSVEVPGRETDALCEAARDANAYVTIGVCEKTPGTIGTMFNSQLYIGPDGRLIRKHQKIMPTVGERLVHMGGYGDTFGAFESEFGPMSGLICGENSNPLAVFALIAEGTRIHVMSWPNHFPTSGDPLRNRVAIDTQAFAQMSKAFVISACGTVDERMIEMLKAGPEGEKFLRDPNCCGGSMIVDPLSHIIAGPMGAEEGILYADCNLELGIQMKLRHDFAGHYNRPDIFQLHINRAAPQLYRVHNDPAALAGPNGDALPCPSPAAHGAGQGRRGIIPSPGDTMDVFEAVDSRIACRWFHRQAGRSCHREGSDREGAARRVRRQPAILVRLCAGERRNSSNSSASSPNASPTKTRATSSPSIRSIRSRCSAPTRSAARSMACSFTARSASTATTRRAASRSTSATSNSSTRRSRCSSRSTASSAPANGPTSAATSTPSLIWRAAMASTPARRRPGRGSTTRSANSSSCRRSRCCSARIAIGYGDRKHKANDFRSPRAELSEFCKFYGFD